MRWVWIRPLVAAALGTTLFCFADTPSELDAQTATGAVGMGWVRYTELTPVLPGGDGFELWGSIDIADVLRLSGSLGQGNLNAPRDSVGELCLDYLPFLRGCTGEEPTRHRRSVQDYLVNLQVLSPFWGGWRAAAGVAWHQTDNQAFRRGLTYFADEAVLGPVSRVSSGLGLVGTIESQGFDFLPLVFQAQVHLIRVSIQDCVAQAQWDICGEWGSPRYSLGVGIPIRRGSEF